MTLNLYLGMLLERELLELLVIRKLLLFCSSVA